MTDIVAKRVEYTLNVKRGSPTTFNVSAKPVQTIAITSSGLRGPQGERGEQGPPGPIGNLDNLDLPDFTLIFENQLV